MIAPPTILGAHSDVDSDSDWDDGDDFVAKKIDIKIKPIAQVTPSKMSASVEELRATVGTWKSLASINLVKPNSRRLNNTMIKTAFSSSILNLDLGPNSNDPISKDPSFPVAFAIQECLNARMINGRQADGYGSMIELVGHVKLATPPYILDTKFTNDNLVVSVVTSVPWSNIKLNQDFVREVPEFDLDYKPGVSNQTSKKLSINMSLIRDYIKKSYQKSFETKYFLLPELMSYVIKSHDKQPSELCNDINCLNPLKAMALWLCDLDITKVRIDFDQIEESLKKLNLSSSDITNLKITLTVSGGVTSHQSKPEANWNPLTSTLTWSFSNVKDLISKSTIGGITSCLARFDLDDGPSSPADVNFDFTINGKTLSKSQVILLNSNDFRIVTHKLKLRTGIFKCELTCQ